MQHRNPDHRRNGDLELEALGSMGGLEPSAVVFGRAGGRRGLSSRSSLQVLRIGRTIADLNDRSSVDESAIAEALGFRCDDLLREGHSALTPSR